MTIEQLNERFAVPGAVSFDAGPGGLARAVLTGAGGRAAVLLHGAHVTEFQPAGQRPVLWMSALSRFQPGQAVRGGVPVCWPWFSDAGPKPDCPNHGLARLLPWQVRAARRMDDGRAAVLLSLGPDALTEAMRAWWPAPFELELAVTVGGELMLELTTRNPGDGPLTITEALHSYFAVSDVRRVRLEGLAGCDYLDTVGQETARRQGNGPIAFDAETDRDYLDTTARCEVVDAGWGRRIVIDKSGSRSTVVWNPWIAKSARMADFGDDEWQGMLCVETANIRRANAAVVPPGGSHVLAARLSVEGE